ncbi:hypothetical protein [Micromonospora sp. WMMD736]|uniref:hypothetical protein n=1 Tax=Micromonospora sp. WMMD736 TaxID=3404112 RepID=UPI003B9594A4
MLAIALAVVITVVVVRPDSGGDGPEPGNGGSDSEFASADDTGPVNIITEDPTCEPWSRVSQEYVNRVSAVNWDKRDSSIPESSWNPEQRRMYETVSQAIGDAASDTIELSRQTPHRVMRELYQQFIAYGRAFVESVPSYVEGDDAMLQVMNLVNNAVGDICSAIIYRSVQPIAPLLPDPAAPSKISAPSDAEHPLMFLSEDNPVCSDWESLTAQFNDQLTEWQQLDPKIPAAELTPEQRTINDAAAQVMATTAMEMERLGRQSENSVFEDISTLSAQYWRAYVKAVPSYTSSDNFLSQAAIRLTKSIDFACKAA